MAYDPYKHHRRSIRLRGYDYAGPGAYFITVCTHRRICLFGDVVNGVMRMNARGCIVAACWDALPDHFPRVLLDAFVVMPNHVHGILAIVDGDAPAGATHASPLRCGNAPSAPFGNAPSASERPCGPPPHSVGAIVGSFKSAVTKHINRRRGTPGAAVWQRNYYERIIRHERALHRIRRYIAQNPQRWAAGRDTLG